MAGHRVLPPVLGIVSPRYATPAVASVVVGVVFIAATWVYLLSGSIANAFTQLIDVTGVLYASFYILTALSAIVYYRATCSATSGTPCSSASCRWARPPSWSGSWSSRR